MSDAKRIEVVQVVLTLTLEEASWLRAAIQNPLHAQELSAENANRSAIWHALNEALTGDKTS